MFRANRIRSFRLPANDGVSLMESPPFGETMITFIDTNNAFTLPPIQDNYFVRTPERETRR